MKRYRKELSRIKTVLKENPKGMTITDISRGIDLNRNSVAKYLGNLLVSGQVEMTTFGPSKVYYLSQRVPISTMLNLSTDYIVVLDRYLKVVHANDAILNFSNMTRKLLLGQSIEETPLPVLTNEEVQLRIKKAINGKDSTIEIKFQMDDREFYFRIKLIPTIFNDGGQGVTILIEDITEWKKTEEELRFSEAKFRGLFENVLCGVYQTTPEGKILSANPALVQMLGYNSEEELCDVRIGEKLYADTEKREILTRELEKKGTLHNIELKLKRKDDGHITVLENARVVRDTHGKVLYYEGTLTDITERKKAEMELKSLFEVCRLINSTVDIDKIFTFIANSVQKLIGFDNFIIFLLSRDKKTVYPTYVSEEIRDKREQLILNYGEGLVGHSVRSKETLLLENANEDTRGKRIPGLTELFVSQIVVPLVVENKSVGALHISRNVPNVYNQRDLEILQPLSEIVTSALRNFWLYDKLRRLDAGFEEKIVTK